ncbi:Sensor protein (fragment) [Acetoanaerobium sticklandii]|uniref:histidine kinase n=2 Tax=Acetoanaerobium sticklandii TaxID=1511 RepID=E3PR39_ACESD
MNSIEHGFSNKEKGKIYIKCTADHEFLYMHYEDDGIGISSENLKQIYEPFFTTNRQNGNSGLGMNIVFNLVNQKLKGTMSAQSTPLEFTSFDFKIPI